MAPTAAPPRLKAPPRAPAPMPCEKSPTLPTSARRPPKTRAFPRDVTTSCISVEERDVAKSLRRLDGLLLSRKKQPAAPRPRKKRNPPTPPSDGAKSDISTSLSDFSSPRAAFDPRRDAIPEDDARVYPGHRDPRFDQPPPPRHAEAHDQRRRPEPAKFGYRPPAHGVRAPPNHPPPQPDGPGGMVVQTSLAYLLTA